MIVLKIIDGEIVSNDVCTNGFMLVIVMMKLIWGISTLLVVNHDNGDGSCTEYGHHEEKTSKPKGT